MLLFRMVLFHLRENFKQVILTKNFFCHIAKALMSPQGQLDFFFKFGGANVT